MLLPIPRQPDKEETLKGWNRDWKGSLGYVERSADLGMVRAERGQLSGKWGQ